MSDRPYSTQIHSTAKRKEIKKRYEEVKDHVNSLLTNMDSTMTYLQGYLQPVESSNNYKSDAINKETIQNLQGLSQNFANIHTPLYGNNEPCHLGMAEFLDQYDVLASPEKTLTMISDGKASPTQVATFKQSYPSQWNDYVQASATFTYQSEISPEQRALLYGNTGIETSPSFSRAKLEREMQELAFSKGNPQSQGLQQQQQSGQTRKLPLKIIENNPYFAPASSDRGKSA